MNELIIIMISLAIGSFANNIISFYTGVCGFDFLRSQSPCCNMKLKTHEVIPLFSYLALKGKCVHCGKKIPLRYILIEVLTALTGILCYLNYGITYDGLLNFIICYILIIIAAVDLKSLIIPNLLVVLLLGSSLAKPLITHGTLSWQNVFAGTIICGCLIIVNKMYYSKKEMTAIGYGDIKLIFALCLLYEPVSVMLGIWLASLLGLTAYLLYRKYLYKTYRSNKIPFGTALGFCFILITLYGNSLIAYYFRLAGL